jgi:hypothetical protein
LQAALANGPKGDDAAEAGACDGERAGNGLRLLADPRGDGIEVVDIGADIVARVERRVSVAAEVEQDGTDAGIVEVLGEDHVSR